jgi:membrane fusion protein, multidrug efflux system
MRNRSNLLAAGILAAVSLSACSALGQSDSSSAATETAGAARGAGAKGGGRGRGEGAAVPVVTARAEARAVPITIPAVGAAEAVSSVQIRAQVTGQLSAVHFTEGQEVQKGQPLFTLDARPFEIALDQAQAVLARDTATAENAKAQQGRAEDLYKRQLISRDQYETQMASTASLQATLQADRAAIDNARLNLQYTKIIAPITGRTGSLGVHAGDLIRANDTNPMVVINQFSPIYVTFSIPGRYLQDVRRYQAQKPLTIQARGQASDTPGSQPPAPTAAAPDVEGAETGSLERGAVTFIDNAVDATTGTIKLKGTFPNTDRALWPGLFVQVTLLLSVEPNAIVVPAVAVQASQNGQYVYVVKEDRTVELRPVTISRQQGDVTVIARGVTAGEEVVTDGQLRLIPGARVSTGRGGPPGAGRGRETGASDGGGARGPKS